MSSFWERKLGGQTPTRPAVPPQTGYQQQPQYPQQQAPAQQQQQQQQQYQGQPQYPQQEPMRPEDYVPTDPRDPYGHNRPGRAYAWQGNFKDGAARSETYVCPGCGSPRFFTKQGQGGIMNERTGQVAYPKAECFECGYPNNQGTIGLPSQVSPGVAPSRQGSAPPPPDSIGTLSPY